MQAPDKQVPANYFCEEYVSSHKGIPKFPNFLRISADKCGPPAKLEEKCPHHM